MQKRCDVCGRFVDHLNDVWITQPYPSIDHEACDRCYGSADLARAIAAEYIMEREPSPGRAR